MPADGLTHHLCCGRKQLRASSLKNKSHIVPLNITKGICDLGFILSWSFPPTTSPLLPPLRPVLFPSHTSCDDIWWLGWGWPHLRPPILGRVPMPGQWRHKILPTIGIGWRRWAGASSWTNKNQLVVLQELLESGAKLVGCISGPTCQGPCCHHEERPRWVWTEEERNTEGQVDTKSWWHNGSPWTHLKLDKAWFYEPVYFLSACLSCLSQFEFSFCHLKPSVLTNIVDSLPL